MRCAAARVGALCLSGAIAALPFPALAQVQPGVRVALVAGIGDCRLLPPLPEARETADAVADGLTVLGHIVLGYRVSRLADPERRPCEGVLAILTQQARLARPARPLAVLVDTRPEALPRELRGPWQLPSVPSETLVLIAAGGKDGMLSPLVRALQA